MNANPNTDNLEGEPPSDAERAANYRALHKLTREERFRLMTSSKRLGGPDAPHVGYNPDGTPITQKQYLKEELASRVPAFPLPDLLAGKHNDSLCELAAKSVGWQIIRDSAGKHILFPGETIQQYMHVDVGIRELPSYPTSRDACQELLDSLTDEEWLRFEHTTWLVTKDAARGQGCFQRTTSASPLQLLIAYCLAKNLIKLQ